MFIATGTVERGHANARLPVYTRNETRGGSVKYGIAAPE